MRYKAAIIDRVIVGLSSVANDEEVAAFKQAMESVNTTVAELANVVNSNYQDLMVKRGIIVQGTPLNVGVPENNEAIAFWIEDLESATLPKMRDWLKGDV